MGEVPNELKPGYVGDHVGERRDVASRVQGFLKFVGLVGPWLYARRSRSMMKDNTCDRRISNATYGRNLLLVWAVNEERNTQSPVSVTTVEGVGIRLRFGEPGRPVTANGVSTKGENASGTRESRCRYQIRMKHDVFVRKKK